MSSKYLLSLIAISILTIPSVLSPCFINVVSAQSTVTSGVSADQLFQQGQKRLSDSQYEAALKVLREAFQLYHQGGNRVGEGNALSGIGDAEYGLGQYEQALESYLQAQSIYQQLSDRKNESTVLNNIGAVYDDQKDFQNALKFYDQALKIRHEMGDLAGEATTLNNRAGVLLNLGDYDKSLKTYEDVLKIRRTLGDQKGEATTLNNIGFVCRTTGQFYQSIGQTEASQKWYQSAVTHYQSALEIRRTLNDPIGEATTLNNLGFVQRSLGNYKDAIKDAIKTYQDAVNIYTNLGDLKGKTTVLNNLGGLYLSQEEFAKAKEVYEQALATIRQSKNLAEEATTLSNVAFVYRTLGDAWKSKATGSETQAAQKNAQMYYSDALKSYQQAASIIHELGDLSSEAATFNNIGWLYLEQGQYLKALATYQNALQLYQQTNDSASQGLTLHNIGVAYARQEKYLEALKSYEQALQIVKEPQTQAAILRNIGSAYAKQGDYRKALESYQQALLIRREVGDRTGEEDIKLEIKAIQNRDKAI